MTCQNKCETARRILELEDKISQLTEQLRLKDEEALVAREELSQARTEISRLEEQIDSALDKYRDLLLSRMRTTLRELRSYIKRCLIRESVADQVGDLERRAWDIAVKAAEENMNITSQAADDYGYENGEQTEEQAGITGNVIPWLEDDVAPVMADAMVQIGVEGDLKQITSICVLIYQSLYTDNGNGNQYGDMWTEVNARNAESTAKRELHSLICSQYGVKDVTGDSIIDTAEQMIDWLKQNRSALITKNDNRVIYIASLGKGEIVKRLVKEFKERFYMPDSATARKAILALDRVLQSYDYEAMPDGYSLGDRTRGSLKPILATVDNYAQMCIDGMKQEEELRQSTNRRSLPCKSGPI